MDKIWTLAWQWNCSDTAEKLLSSLNWEILKYWRLLGSGWSHRKQLNQPSVPGISLVSFSSSPSALPFPWESPETHGWLQGKHTNMYRAVHPLIWLMFREKWSKATAWTADWLKQSVCVNVFILVLPLRKQLLAVLSLISPALVCRSRLNCVLTWSGPPSGPQSHQYQGRPQKIQRQSLREEVTLLTVPKTCCFEWSLVRC